MPDSADGNNGHDVEQEAASRGYGGYQSQDRTATRSRVIMFCASQGFSVGLHICG